MPLTTQPGPRYSTDGLRYLISASNHSVRSPIQHWETKIFGQCLKLLSLNPDTALRDQDTCIWSVPLTTQPGPRYSTDRSAYLVSDSYHLAKDQIHHWETKIFGQCLWPLSQGPDTALREQDICSMPLTTQPGPRNRNERPRPRYQDIWSVPLTTQPGLRYSTERPKYLDSASNHSARAQVRNWETKIFGQCL